MSAFVVSHHHIDLLVSAAIERGIPVCFGIPGVCETVTEANAQAVGLMLWSENVRSVVYRYNLGGTAEERQYKSALAIYRFRFCFYPGVRPAAAANALACFDYQSCECPDYPDSPAALFVRQVEGAIGGRTVHDAEPWGIDSEAQVMAAQGGVQ